MSGSCGQRLQGRTGISSNREGFPEGEGAGMTSDLPGQGLVGMWLHVSTEVV